MRSRQNRAINRTRTARRVHLRPAFSPSTWLERHFQVALGSLGSLLRTPMVSLMTVSVIGIALALPSGLMVMLGNLQQVLTDWEGPASISLFLKPEVSDAQAAALGNRITQEEKPDHVQVIGRAEALDEFRRHSGFGDILDVLEENPLPAVIQVRPAENDLQPAATSALTQRLGKLPEVEIAQLDLQWVQRLHGIAEIAQRGAWLIATLLALAVLLIVGNTIRLEIQNRHDEIAIAKLVGATDAFVRRPFLYYGLWLGLLGAVSAWVLVALAVVTIEPPVTRLAELYHSGFRLLGPGLMETVGLLVSGALTGWLGAWAAVGRHISAIEPK